MKAGWRRDDCCGGSPGNKHSAGFSQQWPTVCSEGREMNNKRAFRINWHIFWRAGDEVESDGGPDSSAWGEEGGGGGGGSRPNSRLNKVFHVGSPESVCPSTGRRRPGWWKLFFFFFLERRLGF